MSLHFKSDIDLNKNLVKNLKDPETAFDATNKDYVDKLTGDLDKRMTKLDKDTTDAINDVLEGIKEATSTVAELKEKVGNSPLVYSWNGINSTSAPNNLILWQEIVDKNMANNPIYVICGGGVAYIPAGTITSSSTGYTIKSYVISSMQNNSTYSDTGTQYWYQYGEAVVAIASSKATYVSDIVIYTQNGNNNIPRFLPTNKQDVKSYTPTYDYHPATKKYVDESSGDGIYTDSVLGFDNDDKTKVPEGYDVVDEADLCATTSKAGLMSKEDKEKLNRTNICHGICATGASVASKIVTIGGNPQWKLEIGSRVSVKFNATNSANNPTLNVNGTGAKTIIYGGNAITTTNLAYAGKEGYYIDYLYDGTYWEVTGMSFGGSGGSGSGVAYGTCSTASGTASKVITLDGSFSGWTLGIGAMITIKFTYTNSANNPTLNVNGTGAKSIWYNSSGVTSTNLSSAGWANHYITYMYDGTYWVWIGWGCDNSGNSYSNASMGNGYGTCSTASTTTAKTATLAEYALQSNGFVAIKFTNAVKANATLSINGQTAKPIYYRGSAITDDIIGASDIALFIYDGTNYHLITTDNAMLIGEETT